MTASTTSLEVIVGNQTIDRSVVPIVPITAVVVRTVNMKPGAVSHFWCDNEIVDEFVQPISFLSCNVGFNANLFTVQEGVYCPNTHAYAVVQENSQGTILHIAENYACINLVPYGANTFSASQYTANSIVYQANNTANVYANTVIGKVAFWDYANGALAITVTSGTLNNVSSSNVLFTVGSTKLANIKNMVLGNKFPTGQTIVSVANTAKFFLANTYVPNHGLITATATGTTLQVGALSPNVNVVGNTIYIVRGTGIGQKANILTWNTGTGFITIDTAWAAISGDSYYGIGKCYVDAIGLCTGIFHIPEDINYNFQSGSRLITINDSVSSATDNNATMRSTATFVASGQLPIGTAQTPVVPKTPPLSPIANTTVAPSAPTSSSISNNGPVNNPVASPNPLVQTFFTPSSNTNGTDYGCFATSVNLFFSSVPTGNATQFPVSVYLVDTVNGFPTSNVLGISTMRYEQISWTDGQNTFPNSSNSQTYTKFSFAEPIYLAPGTEYGIAIYSESPEYDVWVSQLGETVVNGSQLVSSAPYVGSFFEAQNASAWNPIPNQQLMFVLNKAAFSLSPTSLTFQIVPPTQNTYMDMVALHSADLTFPVANITYGIQTTTANSRVTDSGFKSVGSDTPFYYGGDLVNSSLDSDRRRLIQEGNANSVLVQATLSTTNPDVSPVFHAEPFNIISFGNIINTGGISQSDISITAVGNHINAANIVVTFTAPTGDNPITATANVLANGLSGNNLIALNIINPGAGYVVAPTVTITEAASPANATVVVTGENSTSGGNGNVRYVTRPITLADGFASGDLNVFLQAIRPQGTDILVYYKILGTADTQPISNISWQLMTKENDIYSPDQQTPINLAYNTGYNSVGVPIGSAAYVQNGVQYPIGGAFGTFMIKIVLFANDPTVPPEVQNLRAIAVPSG
jgi:hypothetical protein